MRRSSSIVVNGAVTPIGQEIISSLSEDKNRTLFLFGKKEDRVLLKKIKRKACEKSVATYDLPVCAEHTLPSYFEAYQHIFTGGEHRRDLDMIIHVLSGEEDKSHMSEINTSLNAMKIVIVNCHAVCQRGKEEAEKLKSSGVNAHYFTVKDLAKEGGWEDFLGFLKIKTN